MTLTTAQKATLKTNIQANGDALAFFNIGDLDGLAALYNLPASPAFRVWRTNIPTKDVKLGIVWTEYISRSQGERDAFEFMLSNGIINAADLNIRQGIADVFSGAGGATSRTNLTNLSKRDATRAEKLFATGTGSEAVPATMVFEGPVSYVDLVNL